MDKSQKNLVELGLAPNEALIYLASLELGPATAQQLAGKAAVVRPTAYVAIGGLVKRGLMSQFKKGKKAYFQAEKPERLAHLLEIEKREIIEREAKLKEIMPMLASLVSHSGDKPEVKYHEGFEGLESIREMFFSSKAKEIDVITSTQYNKVVSEDQSALYDARFSKSAISGRLIKFSDDTKRKSEKFLRMENGNSVWLNKFIYSPKPADFGEIAIFKSYVALIVYSDKPYGFLIQSQQVANTVKAMFDGFWGTLPAK